MSNNTIFCYSCGREIHQSAASCPQCGASQQRNSSNLKYKSYKDVPLYRRNWFAILMAFTFVPVLLLILITGGVYYERNGLKKYSILAKIFLIAWSGLGTLIITSALLSAPDATEKESFDRATGQASSTSAQETITAIPSNIADRTIILQFGGDQGIPFGEFIQISEQAPGSRTTVSVSEGTYKVEQNLPHANLRSLLELTPYQNKYMLITRARVNGREATSQEFMGALTEILSAIKYSMEVGGYVPPQDATPSADPDGSTDTMRLGASGPDREIEASPQLEDLPAPDQETKLKPSYHDFMSSCMFEAEARQPDQVFASSIDASFEEAMCQCRYDNLPEKQTMTRSEFMRGGLICAREQEIDAIAFYEKYLRRIRRDMLGREAQQPN